VVAAAGAALIALALVGLQVGILFNELALKSGTQSTADTAQQLLDAADSLNTPFVIVELLAAALLIAWMNRTYQKLPGLGARVVHKGSALVHVSGHAHAGELLFVLNVTRPGNFMPVHGEWRHLRAHAQLAALSGVPEPNIVIADDGVVVDLVDGQAKITGAVPCGYVYVDGLSVGEVTDEQLKDRRILGEEGFISVVIVVDSTTGKMAASPEMHARGSGIDDVAFRDVRPRIEEALARAAAEGITDAHQIQQLVRRTVGRWVSDNYRRRPMIIPVVVEV